MPCIRTFAVASFGLLLLTGSTQGQSLVHLWAFENNFEDTSGSNNHASNVTGAPTFVAGKFGQGVSIASPNDGINLDGFSLANNLPTGGTDSWSTNLWARLDTAPADLEYLAGFGIDDSFTDFDVGAVRAFITFGGETNNNFYFWGGANDVNSGVGYDADSQWHMYTITYNGTGIQMYKDAVPVFDTPINRTLSDVAPEIHVGNPSNWNSNFDGSVDEFAIFNGALSAGQIGGLFFNNDINQPVVFDPSFTVDRGTGEIALTNDSDFEIDILGYTIRSASGSLNSMDWDTIAGRFDAPPQGDGSIDASDHWTVLTDTDLSYSIELSEGVPGTDGGTIAIGKVVNFGESWVANPIEDLAIDLLLNDGQDTIKTITAIFTGNGGEAYGIGDLDANGVVNAADWMLFRTSTTRDLSGKTIAEAYLSGDLDGDFDKDINDFSTFVAAFDADQGAGAFARMTAVPEPSSMVLFGLVAIAFGLRRWRRIACGVFGTVVVGVYLSSASAAVWGYYPLNGDANEKTGNNINLNLEGDATFAGSIHPGLGLAGSFDGDGDGMIGSGFNKFVTNDATVVAWTYADDLDGDWDSIVKNWGVGFGGQFHLGLGGGAANTLQNHLVGNGPATATTDLPTEEWVHVAFVINSTTLEHLLYLNGEVIATAPYSGTLGLGTATGLGIGVKPNDDGSAVAGNAAGFWSGRIDDVGLYNEALTTEQIREIYENGLVGVQLDGTTTPYISLRVDHSDGTIWLRNTTADPLSFNAYEIFSPDGALQPADWLDVAGNTGFPTGNGSGNGWEKDLASDEYQLLETFLTGNSELGAGAEISLGTVFGGGAENLQFRYRTENGFIFDSIVEYIGDAPELVGDYNNDGTVNAADYVIWRDQLGATVALPGEDLTVTPGQVTAADYGVWRGNFGDAGGVGSGDASAVPEPSSCSLLVLTALSLAALCKSRRKERLNNNFQTSISESPDRC